MSPNHCSDTLYKKIVLNKRGGWCHELNAVLYYALRELGFDVIIGDGSGWDPLRACWTGSLEHMVLVARLEGKNYMLDVGLGLIAVSVFFSSKQCGNVGVL